MMRARARRDASNATQRPLKPSFPCRGQNPEISRCECLHIYCLGRVSGALPTLPTRPLVFLTPFLLSVLRRAGLDRVFPMLISPRPLPMLFSRAGVFGRAPVMPLFSTSLSPPGTPHVVVVVIDVIVVQLTARLFSFEFGERDVVRLANIRSWNSSSLSDSP